MGKSKATARIERVMTKLLMEGKLDKPFYPNGQRLPNAQSRGAQKKQEPVQPPPPSEPCCVGRLTRLPNGVVPCPDCPLDEQRTGV